MIAVHVSLLRHVHLLMRKGLLPPDALDCYVRCKLPARFYEGKRRQWDSIEVLVRILEGWYVQEAKKEGRIVPVRGENRLNRL